MRVCIEICQEIEREINHGVAAADRAWLAETLARMLLESPALATTLLNMGMPSAVAGALVYDAIERQIRRDALAEMERSK